MVNVHLLNMVNSPWVLQVDFSSVVVVELELNLVLAEN